MNNKQLVRVWDRTHRAIANAIYEADLYGLGNSVPADEFDTDAMGLIRQLLNRGDIAAPEVVRSYYPDADDAFVERVVVEFRPLEQAVLESCSGEHTAS